MPKSTYIAVAAISIDGYIAPEAQPGSNWTSPEDKKFLRETLDGADAIIVGRTTYEIARKPLSRRNCIVLTSKVDAAEQSGQFCLYLNPEKANLAEIIKRLGYQRVIILGGAQTYTYCLEKGFLDELYLTIEPVIFGDGINLFNTLSKIPRLELVSIKKLNGRGSILLKYTL